MGSSQCQDLRGSPRQRGKPVVVVAGGGQNSFKGGHARIPGEWTR